MKKVILLIFGMIFYHSLTYAQFSSGCLSNLEMWYNTTSNTNVIRSGINVTGWEDVQLVDGSQEYDLENTGANSTLPAYVTEDINGYDVVSFGSDDFLYSTGVVGSDMRGSQAMTIYFVLKRTSGLPLFSHADGTNKTCFHADKFYWGTGVQNPKNSRHLDYSTNSVGSDYEIRTVSVSIVFQDSTVGANLLTKYTAYKNGNQIATHTAQYTRTVGSATDSFILGAYKNLNLQGSIAEVMVFKDAHTILPAKLTRLHSYLALKYGISLEGTSPTYTDNDGNDLWPYGTCTDPHSNYQKRVTGIFRDVKCYNIHHNKSTNYATSEAILTGALTDNSGTFANPNDFNKNRQFFLWGDNDGTKTFSTNGETTDIPSGYAITRMKRKWKIREKYNNGGSIGDVTFEFDLSGTDIPNNVDISDVYVLVDTDGDGSFTDETPGTGGVFQPDSWTASTRIGYFAYDFSNCQSFSFGFTTTALPVVWTDFTGIKLNKKVELSWETAVEINNSHYEVEKSLDGNIWKNIGEVSGKGNFNGASKYNFIDVNPIEGVNYYRIKQVDFDGEYTYSKIINVVFVNDVLVNSTVAPNPTSDILNIEVPFNAENIEYNLSDLSGNSVKAGNFASSSETLQVSDVKAGVYFLHLFYKEFSQVHQIVISR